MALRKVDLRNILEDEDASISEKVSGILDLLHNETDAIKDERDDIKAQLDEALKNQDKDDEWKTKYEEEHNAFEEYKESQKNKENKASRVEAYKKLLEEAGVSTNRINSIVRVTDVDSLEFTDGKFADSETLVAGIKNEWSDFIKVESHKGAQTQNPPENNGGKLSTKDIYKKDDHGRYILSAEERQKAIAKNLESSEE